MSGAGAGGFDPNQFAGFEDIFGSLGDLFGFGASTARSAAVRSAASDLRYDLEISFEESFTGTETAIQIPREETCETCKGSGAAAGSSPKPAPTARAPASCASSRASSRSRVPARPAAAPAKSSAKPCQACRGAGRVGRERKITAKIPAGIATGQRLRIYGEGEHGSAGGPPGDLYVVVHVQDHDVFHREDDDLYCHLTVSFPTLAMGGDPSRCRR